MDASNILFPGPMREDRRCLLCTITLRPDIRLCVHMQVGPASSPGRKVRIDQLEVYARPLSDVSASASGAAGAAAEGPGTAAGTAATRLAVASLMPAHCTAQPASFAATEASLREVLRTESAVLGSLLPSCEVQPVGSDGSLRVLAPKAAVAVQWLPVSGTTQAAWQLLRAQQAIGGSAAGERSMSNAGPPGRLAAEPGAPSGDVGAETALAAVEAEAAVSSGLSQHRAYDARSLHQATAALKALQMQSRSADDSSGVDWPDSLIRQYFTALAQVRSLSACHCSICYGSFTESNEALA